MAGMNLQCETGTSREETINWRDIEEAGKRLQSLRDDDNYCKTEAQGAKILRLKAEVDFYYRIKKFPEAKEKAQEALKIAETLQFNLERKPLQERLENIQCKMTESTKPPDCEMYRQTPTTIVSCSGSSSSENNSPHSSEYEIEKDL